MSAYDAYGPLPEARGDEGCWPVIDISVAHEARMYDYLLGGDVNFEVDRAAAHAQVAVAGGMGNARAGVRANREFLRRSVHWLAGEAGVRQFLDIGTGIPNEDHVHAVALETAPDARIVYVDNDPVVLAHAHELLRDTPRGATAFLHADLRDPEDILARAADTLDLDRPIGLLLVSMLHFLDEADDDPYGIVDRLVDAVAPGSYLVISHLTADIQPENMRRLAEVVADNPTTAYRFHMRTKAQVARFFHGLDLVEPGVVAIDRWRPETPEPVYPEGVGPPPFYAAVGDKQ